MYSQRLYIESYEVNAPRVPEISLTALSSEPKIGKANICEEQFGTGNGRKDQGGAF